MPVRIGRRALEAAMFGGQNIANIFKGRDSVGGGIGEPIPKTSIFGFTKPLTPPDEFADLMHSLDVANIDSTTGWSVGAVADAAMTFAGGQAIASGAQSSTRYFSLASPAVSVGKRIAAVADIASVAGGNVSLVGNNAVGNGSKTGAITAPGRYMTNLVASASPVNLRESFVAGVAGIVESAHMFDLDAMLAKKWFIILCIAQSNWVGATRVLDRTIDLPAYGCVVIPGQANPSRGYTLDGSGNGVPALAVDPVAHTFGPNLGGGPTGAMLREVRKFVPADMTPVFVATGYAGAGFAGNGIWAKTSPTHEAYDNFWKQSRATWAAAPAGSIIGGLVLCQGESDLGAGQLVDWQSSVDGVPSLLNEVRAESGWDAPKGGGASHGPVPIVISEIGGYTDSINNPAGYQNILDMIAVQQKLATGSGQPLEYSRCKYVPRPPGSTFYNGDGLKVHYFQAEDRIRGYEVARALHDIIYPN